MNGSNGEIVLPASDLGGTSAQRVFAAGTGGWYPALHSCECLFCDAGVRAASCYPQHSLSGCATPIDRSHAWGDSLRFVLLRLRQLRYNLTMSTNLTDEQRQALDLHDGIVECGDVLIMRMDRFREILGFDSDEELRRQLQIGFNQADSGQLVDWDPEKVKAAGRRRLQEESEAS